MTIMSDGWISFTSSNQFFFLKIFFSQLLECSSVTSEGGKNQCPVCHWKTARTKDTRGPKELTEANSQNNTRAADVI